MQLAIHPDFNTYIIAGFKLLWNALGMRMVTLKLPLHGILQLPRHASPKPLSLQQQSQSSAQATKDQHQLIKLLCAMWDDSSD